MDAKPQRTRMRVYSDENAWSNAQPHKSIHNRHKSQPALKAGFAAAGPQKLGPRKVFGDVSNVLVNKPLRDDSIIKSKSAWEKEKVIETIHEKPVVPATTVVKPLENPKIRAAVSHANLKSSSSTTVSFINKNVSGASQPLPQPVRVVRKSRTTVFQEKPAPAVRPTTVQQDLEFPRARAVAISQQTQVPVPAEPLLEELPQTKEPSSRLVEDTEGVPLHPIVEETTKSPDAYNLPQELPLVAEPVQAPLIPLELDSYESAAEYLPEIITKHEPSAIGVLQEALIPLPHIDEEELAPLSATTMPEPEEYWDEEEDDGYAEDGYVTARSFKSGGESVTVATRTLYLRVDQAVKREIAAAKALVEATREPDDIEDEKWDTSMVAEYGDEIFAYMREMEQRMSPNPHYMDKQTEIQWSMRAVLMDWIVQVHHRFGLLPETLYLCVNLIDRFLSQKIVSLTKLQLVGATAIFLAAKYEEVDCPSVQEVQFMVDNGYKVEEILKAERFMLSMLGFELGFPGPMSFLRRISKADDYDIETRTLAKYFLEVTIMDERFLPCVPSFSAAGAHCLARLMLRKGNWSPTHVYYSEYTYSQLLPLIRLILECCEDPLTHHAAIYEKYLDKRYKKAASFVQAELQHGFHVSEENVSLQSPLFAPAPYTNDAAYWEQQYVA